MGEPTAEPTRQEIRKMCEEIREDWTERDFWIRSGYPDGKPVLEVMRARILSGRRRL